MLSSRLQTFSYLKAFKLDKEFKSLRVNDNPTDLKNKLLNKLRNFNIFEAFYQIGLLYREMLKLNNDSDFMVFAHEFNFKNFTYLFRIDLLLLIVHFFIMSGANKYGKKTLTPYSKVNLMYLSDIVQELQHCDFEINEGTLLNHMCMYYKEQLLYQENFRENLCHNYLIYKEKYAQKIKDITGLDYDTYFRTSLVLTILSSRILEPSFNKKRIEEVLADFPEEYCTTASLIKLLDFLSTNIKNYKSQQALSKYKDLIFLQNKPVIKEFVFNQETYFIPLPFLFLDKLFSGLYYTLQDSYNKITAFRNEFGVVFEDYVGKIVKRDLDDYKILSDKDLPYVKNRSQSKFVDWVVYNDNIAYLIEVKASMLPLSNIYNTNINDFIERHIIKDYNQMISHLKDVNKFKEFEFLRDKKIIPIIIYKDIPLLNTCLFKNAVIKYIEQTSNDTDLIDIVTNDKIYLFNIADFQLFWINKMNIQIFEIFEILESNGGESIRSIIEKHSESNFHIEQWSDIVDRMFDINYIQRNFNIEN